MQANPIDDDPALILTVKHATLLCANASCLLRYDRSVFCKMMARFLMPILGALAILGLVNFYFYIGYWLPHTPGG